MYVHIVSEIIACAKTEDKKKKKKKEKKDRGNEAWGQESHPSYTDLGNKDNGRE